jgi:cadmium resistance protein CadD (predicted permease)
MVAVFCAAGSYLGGRKVVARVLDRIGHWLAPAVFVAIGMLIPIDAGTVG